MAGKYAETLTDGEALAKEQATVKVDKADGRWRLRWR